MVKKQKGSTTCPPAWTEQLLPSDAGCVRQQGRCPGRFGSALTPGRRLPAGMSCWTDTISTPSTASTAQRLAAFLTCRHCKTLHMLTRNVTGQVFDSPQQWHVSHLISYLLKTQFFKEQKSGTVLSCYVCVI